MCAPSSTGEPLVPPGQARMVETRSDYSGCWADVYDTPPRIIDRGEL